MFLIFEYLFNGDRYDTYLIRSRVFAIDWRHCGCCTLLDLDLHLQGDDFSNVHISKTVRAGEKILDMTFTYVEISHRMNMVFRDLDLHFQGIIFSCYAFAKKKWAACESP